MLVSSAAAWLAAVLFAVAVRNLVVVARHGVPVVLSPPQQIPAWAAGWLPILAFAVGLFIGRDIWQ